MTPQQALAFIYQNLQNIPTNAQTHEAFKQAIVTLETALNKKSKELNDILRKTKENN